MAFTSQAPNFIKTTPIAYTIIYIYIYDAVSLRRGRHVFSWERNAGEGSFVRKNVVTRWQYVRARQKKTRLGRLRRKPLQRLSQILREMILTKRYGVL